MSKPKGHDIRLQRLGPDPDALYAQRSMVKKHKRRFYFPCSVAEETFLPVYYSGDFVPRFKPSAEFFLLVFFSVDALSRRRHCSEMPSERGGKCQRRSMFSRISCHHVPSVAPAVRPYVRGGPVARTYDGLVYSERRGRPSRAARILITAVFAPKRIAANVFFICRK